MPDEDTIRDAPQAWGFMLDIETVALGDNAGVLEAALVPFLLSNPLAHYAGRLIQLSLQPQLEMGRALDVSTLKFWLDSDNDTPLRNALNPGGDRESVRESLTSLSLWAAAWANNAKEVQLWSKGAGFDTRILKNLFAQYAVDWPFDFRSERDLRTLLSLANVKTDDLVRGVDEVKHSALGDCRFQIRQYNEAMTRVDLD